MKKLIPILLLLVIFTIFPASALIINNSANSAYYAQNTVLIAGSYIHDANYIPVEFEYLLIAIGLGCLFISRAVKDGEDIFSISAVIPLGLSAWFANYMTFEGVTTAVCGNSTTITNTPYIIYSQVITPMPALSIAMVVFFLLAIVNVVWVFFLQPADAGLDTRGKSL